jgi:tetratricopeptide (TPR) repeat protein
MRAPLHGRPRVRLAASCLLLAGFGPFVCADAEVSEAQRQLRADQYSETIETLKARAADAPEVHHTHGLAERGLEQPAEARGTLDRAYRQAAERATEAQDPHALAAARDLQARVSFAQGLVALDQEDWAAAMTNFERALELDPSDDDARWNLELAWNRRFPPCPLRDDDREDDDTRADAKPYQPPGEGQGGQPGAPGQAGPEGGEPPKRRLCPADEDWYTFPVPRLGSIYVRVEGEIKGRAGEPGPHETRDVSLKLYRPNDDRPIREAKFGEPDAGKAVVGVTGAEAGEWAVQLSGPGRAELEYTISVETFPPCPADDRLEENDTPEEAKPVEDGQQPGLKACPDDADWYRITVPAEEKRNVSVQHDPRRGKLEAAIFDLTGSRVLEIARDGPSGASTQIEAGEQPKTVLLRVGMAGDLENTYTLAVSPPQDNEGGDGDSNDQNQDQENQDDKDQGEDQQKQSQPQQNEQQQQSAVDVDQLIDAIDKHEKNPQLEKMLRRLPTVPQLEDY